jgi:hypothetical protein
MEQLFDWCKEFIRPLEWVPIGTQRVVADPAQFFNQPGAFRLKPSVQELVVGSKKFMQPPGNRI